MPPDYEKVKMFLEEMGIGYTTSGPHEITVNEGNVKVSGYPYFYFAFWFTPNGTFREVNIGE